MKKLAEPAIIPPAMGACTRSLATRAPLKNNDMMILPMMAAPIATMMQKGPNQRLKALIPWQASSSMERKGKIRKMMSAPKADRATVLKLALFRGLLLVEQFQLAFSRILRMKPSARPMNPPKVKMLKVPKLSVPRLLMTWRLSSKPTMPKRETMRHSRLPALPRMLEKATKTARAQRKQVVIVFEQLLPAFISKLESRRVKLLLLKSVKLGLSWIPTLIQKALARGQNSSDRAVTSRANPRADQISLFRQANTSPKPL